MSLNIETVETETSAASQVEELKRQLADLMAQLADKEESEAEVIDPPRYKLIGPCYFDDCLYPEGSELAFLGMPNMSMVPLNAQAKAKTDEMIAHQEAAQRERAEMEGMPFRGLITDQGVMIAQENVLARRARALDRPTIAVPVELKDVPVLGHMDTEKKRRGRPRRVLEVKDPEPAQRMGLAGPAGGMNFGGTPTGGHQVFGG